MSFKRKFFNWKNPHKTLNAILAKRNGMTLAEREVKNWLLSRGIFDYEYQKPVGSFHVDFYLPREKTIIEADGGKWHSNQKKDIERDKKLLSLMPDTQITHIHFINKGWSPKLNLNPLPNVHYVPCNPGTCSFAEPKIFEPKKILSIRKWKYVGPEKTKHASRSKYLYDLAVEGVHSYVASGMVISNCWLELGLPEYFGITRIYPVQAQFLSWIDPISGERIFAKSVQAVEKRSFLQRTMDEMQQEIIRTLGRRLGENVSVEFSKPEALGTS